MLASMYSMLLIILIFSATTTDAQASTSIAVVTSDKSQTRLKLLRDSPQSLVKRLNSEHKGGRSEDIARTPVTSHQWVALDFDFRRKEYYVVDRLKSSVLIIVDDPRFVNKTEVLFEGISSKVTALAYDWLRRSWFWPDSSYQAILSISISHPCRGVSCSSATEKRKLHVSSIIGKDLTEPCGIAVDPVRGYLYWADDGAIPCLEMSTLEGHNRTLLARGLIRPAGLTLDYQNNILYWIERLSGLSVINSCLLNELKCITARVSTVYQSKLYDMDFHMGFLIASDQAENRLVIYDYTSGQTVRQNWFGTTFGICVSSLDRQPWKEISESDTVDDHILSSTFKNITEHGVVFLASVQTGIFVLQKMFPMNQTSPSLLPLIEETGITTMAVDVRRRRLFLYSQEQKSIFRIDLPESISQSQRGTRTEIMKSWVKSVTGMAVDWSNGNLYWLDVGYQRIMVSGGDGSYAKVIHYENIMEPRDLVIDSNHRYMVWSDASSNNPRIERSDLDGHNRMVLLSKNAFYDRPQALAVDFRKNRLYWSDGPYICQATMNGNSLEDIKRRDYTAKTIIKAIDIMHDYILWTDFIGGVRSADVDLDFPLSQVNMAAHFSDSVFDDVIYFHESRQSETKNRCIVKYFATSSSSHDDIHADDGTINSGGDNSVKSSEGKDYVKSESDICSQLCLMSRSGPQCACATGYWLKSNGSCLPGVVVDDFLIFCDVMSGLLFRQFTLLPDYYVWPIADHTHVTDVAVDDIEKEIYWIDSDRNMIHAASMNDTLHHVVFAAGNSFKLSRITLVTVFRLLYIVTSDGDVIAMSLTTRRFAFLVRASDWIVHDVAVNVDKRQLYMAATSKPSEPGDISKVVKATTGAILHADLDGANLQTYIVMRGRPHRVTLNKGSIIWTDPGLRGIYSSALKHSGCRNVSSTDDVSCPKVMTLTHLDHDSSPGDVLVSDDVVYFTDESKQSVQRFNLHGPVVVTSLGFPFMNRITGLSHFSSRSSLEDIPRVSCSDMFVTSEWSECLCRYGSDLVAEAGGSKLECQYAGHYLSRETEGQGLCLIVSQPNAGIQGGIAGNYVLSGHQITVTCDPGHLLSQTMLRSETRQCVMGDWTSMATCNSVLNYTVHGNISHGYVVFTESTLFIVPRGVTEVDVVCVGGGGGGYDGCDKELRKNRARAGMGEVSKFGSYLHAYGGQGGTLHEGGRGGRGRSLFGGDGQLSSSCLGGGAAGETQSPSFCRLSSTSCLFCGAGGAMPSCSVCPFRPGGCSGLGSVTGYKPGAADNFGGGATGTFGGGSGGGGGFSRKIVHVSSLEEVAVKVGRGGVPSAKPAGTGVVVVGWGTRLENVIDKPEKITNCKPFTYKLDDENTINFPDRCF